MAQSVAQAEEIQQVWQEYKKDPTNKDLRNRLMERYFPLVKYNGERIWQRLPDGVEVDDLISAGVFGLRDAIDKIRELQDDFDREARVTGGPNEPNSGLEKALRVQDYLELGELMCRDALQREESCGVHYRLPP